MTILREILLDSQEEESIKVLFIKQSFESEHFYKQKLDETDSFKSIVKYC